jgi:hypothetical protein
MRKPLIIALALLWAVCAFAQTEQIVIPVAVGTNTGATLTVNNINGMVESVYIWCTDKTSAATGVVAIAAAHADITIATAVVTNSQVFRPRVDTTTTAGADNTSDPPTQFILAGDSVKFTVSNSATGKVWQAVIKLRK